MKRTLLVITSLLTMILGIRAQQIVDGVSVGDFRMARNGDYMVVDMEMNMASLDVDANRAVLLTPRLKNGADSLNLPAVGIYGRKRYYFYVRNGMSMLSGSQETSYRAKKCPDTQDYHAIVPYADWMDGAKLTLHRDDYGCCNTLLAAHQGLLGEHAEPEVKTEFFPELVYITPQAEVEKSRSLEGSAYVDFVVNRTDINPTYRNNVAELGKIQATIDSVRADKDITITSVWLKGFASPESPYAYNKKLAIGRTEAVKGYIQKLFSFAPGIIATDHEPENWEGLRQYVEESTIEHKDAILALIDSDMDPDAKERKIKSSYPAQYTYLLRNCYPALRRTDYRIAYTIRTFTDVAEIRRILQTQPQKLSLNEFYLVAQELEPGTPEFTNVFETAVRMFPDDPTANLNAANAAMNRDDLVGAKPYLDKAGTSAHALYARGVYHAINKEYTEAKTLLQQAESKGLTQAHAALQQIEEILEEQSKIK